MINEEFIKEIKYHLKKNSITCCKSCLSKQLTAVVEDDAAYKIDLSKDEGCPNIYVNYPNFYLKIYCDKCENVILYIEIM